jgi:hypothetical protein
MSWAGPWCPGAVALRLHAVNKQTDQSEEREGILIKHMWTAGVAALFAVATAQAQETIKIGVNEPLTGAVAASGT